MAQKTAQLMVSNIPANTKKDVFRDADSGESDFRFIAEDAILSFTLVANAVGILWRLSSQFRNICEESTLDSSGTTGQYASVADKGQSFEVYAGEKLRLEVRDTAGVATTDVMFYGQLSS